MLASTIKRFQLSGFPLTVGRVCQLAYQYATVNQIPGFSDEKQAAGRKWLNGFLKRHPEITLRKAQNLSIARAMGANPTVITNWFELLKKIMDTCNITTPHQIWSGDETGIQNVPKEIKVLGMKKIRTFQQVSAEQGETSTMLSFVNAAGQVCPPMVIHKGQWVQETWRMKAPGDMQLAATDRGYITKSRFHQYGVSFIKYLKQEGLANHKNLLIVDGHKSHLYNLPFYEVMRENNVEVLTIPCPTLPMYFNRWTASLSPNSRSIGKRTYGGTIYSIPVVHSTKLTFGTSSLPHGIMQCHVKTLWLDSAILGYIPTTQRQYPPRQWHLVR